MDIANESGAGMLSSAAEMVLIPAGDYLMGNDRGRKDELPGHHVRLDPFLTAVSPVTNAEYLAYVDAAGAPRPPFIAEDDFGDPDQPVVGISWHDAIAFCAWLSQVTSRSYRLPTEAEREFAALGGLGGVDWPWPGDAFDGHPLFQELASLNRPHVPTEACANGYGLRCMAENVHEWCSDWYESAFYAASPSRNPAGPSTGRRRVSRGGSWRHSNRFTRLTARASLDPGYRYNDFGFRVYADA